MSLNLRNPADAALWYLAHEKKYHDIHYREYRPVHFVMPPAVVTELDCSSFFILCYYASGQSDPSGNGFNGYGNTGTLLAHGTAVTEGNMVPGDAVLYANPGHVVLFIGNGYGISMGQEGDPVKIGIHYRSGRQGIVGYRTFRQVAPPPPQPPRPTSWQLEIKATALHMTANAERADGFHRALAKLLT